MVRMKKQDAQLVEIIKEHRGGSKESSMACLKAVRTALANGADANKHNWLFHYTPLMVAAERWGFGEVIRTLLAHGADANKADTFGVTTLDHAILSEDDANVRILLEGGANMNQPGLLSYVIRRCMNKKILRILIEHGADVNMRDEEGDTALHEAVNMSRAEAVRLLLKAGADPTACNKIGVSPISLARLKNYTEILALLTSQREDIAQMSEIKASISLRSIMLKHNHYGDPIGNELNIGNPNYDACLAELREIAYRQGRSRLRLVAYQPRR